MVFLNEFQQGELNRALSTTYQRSNLSPKRTRFRAYQIGSPGSSFSYFDGSDFTLTEARITDLNRPRILEEMKECGVSKITTLHITSWDKDHCAVSDLDEILSSFFPKRVEYPGYSPHTDTGVECLKIIKDYKARNAKNQVVRIDPPHIDSLDSAKEFGYRNVLYWPRSINPSNSNDNSTVKLFRTGCFNVLSLGDLEDESIARKLKNATAIRNETDVLILAHHGADNGFTTEKFLKTIKPSIAICLSDFGNKYDHPRQEIRDLLWELKTKLYTTKTGDIIIQSVDPHLDEFSVTNLIADSERESQGKDKQILYTSKKSRYLASHVRALQHYGRQRNPFNKFK